MNRSSVIGTGFPIARHCEAKVLVWSLSPRLPLPLYVSLLY